ncbi:MAG: tyrosine-type recombinase/integrase [Candidatus Marinimicrobia bacterium]|nr:tyrosine-type recombinase/integrase [Candidatus Neomarinimicrobiota bacterium]MCF7880170.1 tyrosine-type recombinase/integrase [Candidatus Neomarinimicrobiota bacterium]
MSNNWVITPEKYLSEEEVKSLVKTCRDAAQLAKEKGNWIAVRDWMVIDLALHTGLRVAELSNLRVGDLHLDYGEKSLTVRNGKGGKDRVVKFGSEVKRHIKEYLDSRPSDSEYVFPSSRQARMSRSAIQKMVKKWMEDAGLPGHYSVHSLRHTYATRLYKASGHNLRLVQKQLGHASVQTTQVYADITDADVEDAVERLHEEGLL